MSNGWDGEDSGRDEDRHHNNRSHYATRYTNRPVRSTSRHAVERYRIVDPGADYYDVLAECARGTVIDPALAQAVLGRTVDHPATYETPRDGYILHRFGLVLFACNVHKANDDLLYCVTALRLGDAQRKVLRGLFEERPEDCDRVDGAQVDRLASFRPEIPPLCPIANGGVLAGKMSDRAFVAMCETLLPAARERLVKGAADYVSFWLADAEVAENSAPLNRNVLIRPASGVDKADLKRRFKAAYKYGESELRAHLKKVQQTIATLTSSQKGKVQDG